jgi:hypothetical protein
MRDEFGERVGKSGFEGSWGDRFAGGIEMILYLSIHWHRVYVF